MSVLYTNLQKEKNWQAFAMFNMCFAICVGLVNSRIVGLCISILFKKSTL